MALTSAPQPCTDCAHAAARAAALVNRRCTVSTPHFALRARLAAASAALRPWPSPATGFVSIPVSRHSPSEAQRRALSIPCAPGYTLRKRLEPARMQL